MQRDISIFEDMEDDAEGTGQVQQSQAHSFSLDWFHFQLWPTQYALGKKIHFKLLVKHSKCKNFKWH